MKGTLLLFDNNKRYTIIFELLKISLYYGEKFDLILLTENEIMKKKTRA